MPKIRISSEARAVIRAKVTPGREFRETAVEVSPGVWEVDVDTNTRDTLEATRKRVGLVDYSDVILYLASHPRSPH